MNFSECGRDYTPSVLEVDFFTMKTLIALHIISLYKRRRFRTVKANIYVQFSLIKGKEAGWGGEMILLNEQRRLTLRGGRIFCLPLPAIMFKDGTIVVGKGSSNSL